MTSLTVHLLGLAGAVGILAGLLTLAALIVRNRRRPTRPVVGPPRVKEWLPDSRPPYRWVDAPDHTDVTVVIPAQRRCPGGPR